MQYIWKGWENSPLGDKWDTAILVVEFDETGAIVVESSELSVYEVGKHYPFSKNDGYWEPYAGDVEE